MKAKRKSIENKLEKDESIFRNLISLPEYASAETILAYASLEDEISTDRLVEYSLSAGKRVALPKCADREGNMDFYVINSLSDLKKGYFGIREPDAEKCEKLEDFSSSLLIAPGLLFDRGGYRLGYGGGYYDKFIKNFSFISVGLCYNSFIIKEIARENHDEFVDIIISENEIIYCNGGKNG